jgi:hypothetical protein
VNFQSVVSAKSKERPYTWPEVLTAVPSGSRIARSACRMIHRPPAVDPEWISGPLFDQEI